MATRRTTWILGIFFAVFVLFMYGPMICMAVLSLQDTYGSQTFPARGLFSTHWYSELASDQLQSVRDAIGVSVRLSLVVALITAYLSLVARHGLPRSDSGARASCSTRSCSR